ncbi:leucine-rich repeat protein [Microbacteriaceae bacterium 4G12]
MKNRKMKMLSLLLVLTILFISFNVMPVFATTTGTDANGFTWRSEDGVTYSITGYNGNDTNITIPSFIDGHMVTRIENNAFSGNDGINGNNAIKYRALTSVTIPDTVTSIGSFAFYDCSSLVNISIPNSVTSIGDSAFAYCISLPNITLPTNLSNIGNSTFQDCKALTAITIPSSVTRIGDHAFFECISLTNITIPNGVTSIGESAFQTCKLLNNVVMPDSVISVGDYLFYDCWALTNVRLSNNIKRISNFMFYRCWNMVGITLPNGITSIGNNAFEQCEVLTNITIPNSVLTIGGRAFLMCKALPNITIPNSVKTINYNAFAHCYAFTNIIIPDSVTSIGDYAFYYCTSLTEVTVPQSVTDIGFLTFNSCNSNFKIKGVGGSYAQTYATYNNLTFQELPPIKYTVTFNSDGSVLGSVQADNDTLITAPIQPIKAGYTFGGWYKELTCITPWNFTADKVSSNITLYAKWISNPVAPINIKSVSTGYNSINTSWNAVTGASGYEVWRATSSTGTYSLVNTTTGTSYNNTGLATGTTYYYKVRAYVLNGTTKVYSDYSPIVSAKPVPVAPTGVKSTSTGYNSISTSWSAATGASGYEVWRATSSTGTYSLVNTTTGTSYNNTGLATGTTYYYKVRAYVLNGTTKVYSDYSPIVSAKPVPVAPTGVKSTSTGYNSISTSWSTVGGASGYEVWRSTSSTGTYSLAGTVAGTVLNYNNIGLSTGTTYYYKIRAYRLVGTTKIYGNYSTVVSMKPVPVVPVNFKAVRTSSTSITTSWNTVAGASGYEVYRASSSNGTYVLVKTTISLSFVDKGLIIGNTYYYKVKAYRLIGTTKIYSNFTNIVYAKTY